MKTILLLPIFLCASLLMTAQTESQNGKPAGNPRTASTSAQAKSEPIPKPPYDVNDKYMGRRDEFLGVMTVTELPADFPVYQKEWSLKDYNAVVDAFFINHIDLVKDHYKSKIEYLKSRNQ